MAALLLVRHGRPVVDPAVPAARWVLDPAGFDDVWALRDRLPAEAPVYCSAEPKVVATAELLTDGDVGVVEGLHELERPAGWLDDFDAAVRRCLERDDEPAALGWETAAACRRRVVRAVEPLLSAPAGPGWPCGEGPDPKIAPVTPDERDGAPEVTRSEVPDTVERPAVRLDEHGEVVPPTVERPAVRLPEDEKASSDEDDEKSADDDADEKDAKDGEDADASEAKPRRRDHPTFESLTGFYLGLVLILVVPGGGSALLTQLLGYDKAGPLFPYLALVLLIPLGLLIPERTRRFARYMLLGALLTALVVIGVGALTLWILLSVQS